jgi:hypothetical protein
MAAIVETILFDEIPVEAVVSPRAHIPHPKRITQDSTQNTHRPVETPTVTADRSYLLQYSTVVMKEISWKYAARENDSFEAHRGYLIKALT